MNKILIIDDDKSINEIIKVNLVLSGFDVIQAYDGTIGFALCKQEIPDLIILDVMMPNIDGYTVAKRIRENKNLENIPILMLTALGFLENKVKGFNIGVDDYLVKPFEMDELLVRVKALLKRTNSIPVSVVIKEISTIGDITLLSESYEVKILDKKIKLTPIEFDILNVLVQNHGCMVSSSKLLKEIWGYQEDDDVETIRVHIRHLRSKLDKISNGKKYIQTVYGGGYKLMPYGLTQKD